MKKDNTLEHKDLKSIRKAMYEERRRQFPNFPKSLTQVQLLFFKFILNEQSDTKL